MYKKITLIIICFTLVSCASINGFVKGKSRLHAFSGYGSLTKMLKDVVPEFNECEEKDFNIIFSFVDLSQRFDMYKRIYIEKYDYFKHAPENSIISNELWGVLCNDKLKYVTAKIIKTRANSYRVKMDRATSLNTVDADYFPYLFVAFWEHQQIDIETFKELKQKFSEYKIAKGKKAFAVTNTGVWGYAYEEPTTQHAVTLALETCLSLKSKYPESGPCALVDVNTFKLAGELNI